MNNRVILFCACITGLVYFLWSNKTEALSDPLSRFVSWEKTCTTTASSFRPSSGLSPVHGFEFTNGATQIFIGGINVNATTLGYAVAAAGVKSIDGAASSLYCITAAGSSTVDLLGAD